MLNTRIFFYKKTKILLSLLLIFSLTACDGLFSSDNWDSDDDECDEDTTTVSFKQVAYWIEDETDDQADDLDEVDYSQLTHIIYGYIGVNSDGTLDTDSDGTISNDTYDTNLDTIIADAADEDVKVFISIGGEDSASTFEDIVNDGYTSTFVSNVVEMLDEYGVDGIDLSWQFPEDDDEGELFEDLVEALSDELWDEGYLLSIEVVSGLDEEEDYADAIDSDVFDYVDFVNIRAFNTNNDDNEDDDDDLYLTASDYSDVITYWTDRCLIQNKLVAGIPVYGIHPDTSTDTTKTYSAIVESKTDRSDYACDDDDQVSIDSEYYYFNAIPTVEDKVDYAQDDAGGIMMMSLDQDYFVGNDSDNSTDYSLLNAIYNVIEGNDSVCD